MRIPRHTSIRWVTDQAAERSWAEQVSRYEFANTHQLQAHLKQEAV